MTSPKQKQATSNHGSILTRPVFVGLLLAVTTFIVFWPVTSFDFVNFDDPVYVTDNTRVQQGITTENLRWAFASTDAGFWHPLTWLSLMLDCQVSGARPGWLHFTNVLLHAASTLLLFAAFRRMTGALWRSAFVAALFALHPLHVESVAWIGERKDVLSAFFFMLTLWAYACYAKTQNSKLKIQNYLLVLLFFACGLMSKTIVVTLPVVLLLLDWWPLNRTQNMEREMRNWTKLILEKLPLFGAAVLAGIVTILAEKKAGALQSATHFSIADRAANAAVSTAKYLSQLFWPADLAVFYPYPKTFSAAAVTGAALLIPAVSITALRLARKRPWFAVGWFWYLVTLSPVAGLIQIGAFSRADRYTYLPLTGIFIILAWGIADVAAQWRISKTMIRLTAGLALVLCAMQTRNQLNHWRDSGALFRHALAVTKDNYTAYNNLGTFLYDRGLVDDAVENYRASLQINPSYTPAHNNLGVALFNSGKPEEALEHYQHILRQKPDDFHALDNLANALAKLGRPDEAERNYREALRIRPDYEIALYDFGNFLADQKNHAGAIESFEAALRVKPDYVEAHFNLAVTLLELGKTNEAMPHINEAVRLDSRDPQVHLNLARVLAQINQRADAVAQLNKALQLKPDYAEAKQELQKLGAEK